LCAAWLVCAAWLAASGPAQAQAFATHLSPAPVTDGTREATTGEGRAEARLDGDRLTVSGNFRGLASNASAAELRSGDGIGVPGGKLFDITASAGREGTLSGTVTLSRAQLALLRRGHIYVQIDSQGAPNGNLQGWLLPPHPFAGQDVPVEGHGFLPQLDVPQK
jgi:hypothetical protein